MRAQPMSVAECPWLISVGQGKAEGLLALWHSWLTKKASCFPETQLRWRRLWAGCEEDLEEEVLEEDQEVPASGSFCFYGRLGIQATGVLAKS